MNNPSENRESWKEFQQEMQDWAVSVADVAEADGWDYIGSPFSDLFQWTELRYMDGENARTAEEEYVTYLDHIEEDR